MNLHTNTVFAIPADLRLAQCRRIWPWMNPFVVGVATKGVQGLCPTRCTARFGPPTLLLFGIGAWSTRILRRRLGQILPTLWGSRLLILRLNCLVCTWLSGLCPGSPRLWPLCPSDFRRKREAILPRSPNRRGSCPTRRKTLPLFLLALSTSQNLLPIHHLLL